MVQQCESEGEEENECASQSLDVKAALRDDGDQLSNNNNNEEEDEEYNLEEKIQ